MPTPREVQAFLLAQLGAQQASPEQIARSQLGAQNALAFPSLVDERPEAFRDWDERFASWLRERARARHERGGHE